MILGITKLILAIPFLLVLPGYFFLLAIFGTKDKTISFFEKSVLSVPTSLVLVDFIVFCLNRAGVSINGLVLIGSVTFFVFICFFVFRYRFGGGKKADPKEEESASEKAFQFSTGQTLFFLIALFLVIFIRVSYLADTIVPASTDLGHHMYWSQLIIDSGRLPDYGMPDFIIGEHIVFSAVNLVSGIKIMTAMPVLILLFFNVTGIFSLAILAARLFENRNVTVFTIFTSGVLYAIAAPQGKYISGGVVGNIFGNMLIPVTLYCLFRAIKGKDQTFAGLFVFFLAGLLYTHHLSSFVLIFSVVGILAMYLILNFGNIFKILGGWIGIFFRPFPIAILAIVLISLAGLYTPSYFNAEAVNQATGAPSKETRVGLSFESIELSVGSARLILGFLGAALLIWSARWKNYAFSFALGWALVLGMMSWKPGWLFIDIPSSRVGNYLFLPLSVLAAFGIVKYFDLFQRAATKFFSAVMLYTLMFFVITNGLSDSAEVFKQKNQFQETVEVYRSAEYMSKKLETSEDVVLKDHVNIYADSWYKLFFMKDYRYPLSRGNLTRYVDPTKPRETCTRDMISEPRSEFGKKCFDETGVNYIALNSQIEGNSFEKYSEFSKVYASNYISVFRKD